jgi:NAD(P)-dependent dehydrogenase (short-subunit alcohol dehydrogenase family)
VTDPASAGEPAVPLPAHLAARFSLTGRVAIVTGTSSGLGPSIAATLAEAGAAIVLAARRGPRIKQVAEQLIADGHRAIAVPTDIAEEADCQRLVAAAMTEFGRLDVLVNNAGIGSIIPAHRQPSSEFRSIIEVNLLGTHWMSLAAAGVMRPGASIINISTVLALTTAGSPQAAYAASKAGVLALTRDLAQEWTGRRGIRVNAIVPGFFATELTADHREHLDQQVSRIPAGRLGRPEDLDGALLYLASDASSYVTGQLIVVDGGFVIT